jgi:ankyrin repeat protein
MNSDEKYDLIFNSLLNGTEGDWEHLAQQFYDFPAGLDDDTSYMLGEREVKLGRHWITNAIYCGTFKSVQWIISKGINLCFVDYEGYSPLHSCIDRKFPDKYEMLQLLINSGADINVGTELDTMATNGWSPLHMAAARNDLEAVKILLDNGCRYNPQNKY